MVFSVSVKLEKLAMLMYTLKMTNRNLFFLIIILFLILLFIFSHSRKDSLENNIEPLIFEKEKLDENLLIKEEEKYNPSSNHISVPEEGVKALYLTSLAAASKNFRERIISVVEQTESNAVVIDIKEVDGYVNFQIGDQEKFPFQKNIMKDIESFIQELHDKNIYVIGRVVLFKDAAWANKYPDQAVLRKSDPSLLWSDYGGKKYIDPAAKDFWDYLLNISKESYKIGFDEINLDYIRYPSDGNMNNTFFPHSSGNIEKYGLTEARVKTLSDFMHYFSTNIKQEFPNIILSADVFGMVTTNKDDLTIGQKLEPFLTHFDYVSPMVYPSHYPSFFLNLQAPDLHPYEVVFYSQSKAQDRLDRLNFLKKEIISKRKELGIEQDEEKKGKILESIVSLETELENKIGKEDLDVDQLSFGYLRPWLQDFTCTWCKEYVYYGPEQIQDQIKAVSDSGQKGWMMWNPNNSYQVGDYVR